MYLWYKRSFDKYIVHHIKYTNVRVYICVPIYIYVHVCDCVFVNYVVGFINRIFHPNIDEA